MRLEMVGIDYKAADVSVRELFAATASAAKERMQRVCEVNGILGCVLLSTCNRTELYLSLEVDAALDIRALFCGIAGVDLRKYQQHLQLRAGENAARHLMMVAVGLRSQMRGEDQILAQVKAAAELARETGSSDAVLETLFRCSISAAKKAKTEVPISPVETSVALRALQVLRQQEGGITGKRVLVIGNGEMGRIAASLLAEAGCEVTMTLRSYKRGVAVIPAGCGVVAYEERYSAMEHCDIVVSATASPHYTVRAEELAGCDVVPSYLVDLAVPRDIEPETAVLPGVKGCWNVDTLGGNTLSGEGIAKLMAVKEIIERFMQRFISWNHYRSRLPDMGGEKLG